ncbi:phenylalanine--tRNA ligase subunit beta [Caldichromatium japonicum]|uniref:Phenylalanine--tRNA ligase beta subunit n=1 Tax=Caldichromatium japonicum TaxID=2699430 RepID=A0A6G7VCF4_9GAMM|nr:phenylalanine--tRNA ligase subunit beta [Caldichromatium japonicum]QIK37632.1 phenylalanine--tRNA ligase subunit beta [Caldichromatium japonicum]
MRFSEAWLREWVNPPVESRALIDQLSMAGLEVDAVAPAAPHFEGVRIGQVIEVKPHPDASKLKVCTVDLGQGEPLQIICGAANVAAGMRVPVAIAGACLPGDLRIKRAKLRGIESFGMICSTSELGLAESADGIWHLPDDAPIGEDLRAWLQLDDPCITLDLTPDRGDCLSIAGLAREVAAINRVSLNPVAIEPVSPVHEGRVAVELLAPTACPRYVCRVIRGIDPHATTPLWLRERLRRSGLRAISPVVDVTNYVMLELGQPLHGFDLHRLDGGIRVRLAEPGEMLRLLNGEQIDLYPDTLVIADHQHPVALAGIMGGADSAVGLETRDILLESAFFTPQAISGRARRYGLHTDSSHRFERGVDPELQIRAIERATQLILEIAGGEPGPLDESTSPDHLPRRASLELRPERIEQVLGLYIPPETVEEVLGRLGMDIERIEQGWRVTPPSARFDLLHDVDLIADLGRIHGYDRIPVTQLGLAFAPQLPSESAFDLNRARCCLVERGFQEVITYSFVSPQMQALIAPGVETLALANPISAELSVMRTSLWVGLLQTAAYNRARQMERIRIFEIGLRFRLTADGLSQTPGIGALAMGPCVPEQWGQSKLRLDFFDLKSDVEALLTPTGSLDTFRFIPDKHPALHPGQCARIERLGQPVGWIGMLHPALADRLDLPGDVFVFELDLHPLTSGILPRYRQISRYPAIRRDLAILVEQGISYEAVEGCIRSAAAGLLRELILFDVYTGPNIPPATKSLALGLVLQSNDQTLTDEQVDATLATVLERLDAELGARLRD